MEPGPLSEIKFSGQPYSENISFHWFAACCPVIDDNLHTQKPAFSQQSLNRVFPQSEIYMLLTWTKDVKLLLDLETY